MTLAQEDVIDDAIVESLARALHAIYQDISLPEGETSSQVGWDELPSGLQNANRDLARDLPTKARLIGCQVVAVGDDRPSAALRRCEIELLAELEHERWMRSAQRRGWRHRPGRKDIRTRTSPSIVTWADLPERIRELDRVMIRAIPDVLAVASLRMIRVSLEAASRQVLAHVRDLQGRGDWASARKVLQLALGDESEPRLRRRMRQLLAVSIYKDPQSRTLPALEEGLAALCGDEEHLWSTRDPETLGIAGAIHKRMWEVGGGREHLDLALDLYERGRVCAGGTDDGYTTVNVAMLLDLQAHLAAKTGAEAGLPGDDAARMRARARELREELVTRHGPAAAAALENPTPEQWWLVASVAEAAFGCRDYELAGRLLSVARELPTLPDWQVHSTAHQLLTLAGLVDDVPDAASRQVVADMLGCPVDAVTLLGGKLGLALSGGGFRASFFHLGVLARLAELDVLRHVETLSCVSGGSIVGARYYLELRRRMNRRRDAEMTREEYLSIVRDVIKDFVQATQLNIRRRALTNPIALLKMAFLPGYNRTAQVGRLLDQHLYRPAMAGAEPLLSEVRIDPLDGPHPFDPRAHNWRRSAKVPLLIINATSLNTGHNWQFTPNWMGEPSAFVDSRTDANYRLGRVQLDWTHTVAAHQTLGQAVAASACVPGIFSPLRLDGLYPGKSVRLVDGGVMDNQGVYGLLEQDCNYLIVSDASGQMNACDKPADTMFASLRRSNSILMAAVRNTFFTELDALRRNGQLRGLMYLHLKRELEGELINADDTTPPDVDAGRTGYGIPRVIQRRLAGLRTDLNVFSPAEMHTLMLSGYRMAAHAFPTELCGVPTSDGQAEPWEFRVVERAVDDQEGSPRAAALAKLLGAPDQRPPSRQGGRP